MKNPTSRDVRNAVVLAVVTTVIVMFAVFDRSCQRRLDAEPTGPTRMKIPR